MSDSQTTKRTCNKCDVWHAKEDCEIYRENNPKTKQLKPCPFCGAAVKMETESQDTPPFGIRVWIRCKQCRQSQVCSDWYGGDLGTMEASWQTRKQ